MAEVSRRVKMKKAPACWLQRDRRRYLQLKTLTQKIETLMFLQFGALHRHISHQWLSRGQSCWSSPMNSHTVVSFVGFAPVVSNTINGSSFHCIQINSHVAILDRIATVSSIKLHSWGETGAGRQRLHTESS